MKKSSTGRQASLLVDDEAWERVGRELRAVDPQRYLAVLRVAEDICNIHRDPLGAVTSSGVYVFPRVKTGEID